MEPKISVIVPIYQVEKYLPECLDSIVNQTYRNLEIILVDDASPDRCGAICEEYAARDQRIRVVHRPVNGGLSAARNSGIDVATGEYLMFIDSDDWVSPDACKVLFQGLMEHQADCCAGRCVVVLDKDGERVVQEAQKKPTHCDTAEEAMKNVLLHESSSCNRLYRREAFEGLRFAEGRINEDEPVVLKLYSEMEKIVFLDKDTYYYRKRPDSITTSHFSVKKMDCVYNSLENLEFVKQKMPSLAPCAEYKYIKTMLWCFVNLRKVPDSEGAEAKILRRNLRKDIRNHCRQALHNPYLGFPFKVLALLCAL